MPDVLVLDCHASQSLAAIRALGRRGLTTTVASHRGWNPGRLSRCAGEFLATPDPATAPAASLDALDGVYERTAAAHGPTLVQEFVPHGGERGVYTIDDRDATLAGGTVQERLRSRPPAGGASTLRQTVADPALIEETDRRLAGLDWTGVAMAEFRIDARDCVAKLLEINPRFWGSLPLSIAAGVDFPGLLYDLGVGAAVERDLR